MKKLQVIEDAAEAFGSNLNRKKLGTYGDLGCFSFTPTKIITAAQGGAVVTSNNKLANHIRSLKDQGRTKKKLVEMMNTIYSVEILNLMIY